MKHTSIIVLVLLQLCEFVFSEDPSGHMQPLGSHRPPIEVEIRNTVPDPIEFFDKYIEPGVPVLLKGAAKESKQFKTWKDDAYLRKNYGKWVLPIEVGKYEGAVFGRTIYAPFRFFLDKYKEREYYIITAILPQNPMRDELTLPKAMACGGYIELVEEVLILFSSGATQSALHWDDVENMHCVLDGTKEWIMFDRESREVLPIMKKHEAYGAMDCRKVDMYKYPIVQELSWYHAMVEAGDCLYVPFGWPHHVRSEGNNRNMALAVWFGPVHHPNTTDCPEDLSQLPDYEPIGRHRSTDILRIRNSIFLHFDAFKEVSKENFTSVVSKSLNQTELEKAYNALDKDGNGYITDEEVENLNEKIELFAKVFLSEQANHYQEVEDDETSHNDDSHNEPSHNEPSHNDDSSHKEL